MTRRFQSRAAGALVVILLVITIALATSAHAHQGRFGFRRSMPGAIASVHTRARVVALSFDDGPDPRWTPAVLDALRKHGAHATFFVTGLHAASYPALLRVEQAAGDEIGNHTFDHLDIPRLRSSILADEVVRTTAAIVAAGVTEAPLFRPPHGRCSARSDARVGALGFRTMGWSLALERYLHHASTAAGVRALLDHVRPGMIILAHDGRLDRTRTIEALPLLLDGLRARGYAVVTVGTLLRLT